MTKQESDAILCTYVVGRRASNRPQKDPTYLQKWQISHLKKIRAYRKKYYRAHRKKLLECGKIYRAKNPEAKKAYARTRIETLRGRFFVWKNSAKHRHLKWGLTLADLKDLPLTCIYTGIPLTFAPNCPNTASLDRIDNTKGYVPGNVAFCLTIVNRMKQDMPVSEFLNLCSRILDHSRIRNEP